MCECMCAFVCGGICTWFSNIHRRTHASKTIIVAEIFCTCPKTVFGKMTNAVLTRNVNARDAMATRRLYGFAMFSGALEINLHAIYRSSKLSRPGRSIPSRTRAIYAPRIVAKTSSCVCVYVVLHWVHGLKICRTLENRLKKNHLNIFERIICRENVFFSMSWDYLAVKMKTAVLHSGMQYVVFFFPVLYFDKHWVTQSSNTGIINLDPVQ